MPPALEARCAAQARRLLRVVALDVLGASASCAITALALLRVFYERHAYAHASPERVVPACIFLASKLEEEPRRVSDVVNATHRALYPKPEDPVVVTRARLRIDVADRDVEAIAAAETLLERSRERRRTDGGGGDDDDDDDDAGTRSNPQKKV